MLEGLSEQLRAARGGGTPLLSLLRQTATYSDKLSVFSVARIGRWFPELTDLTVATPLAGPSPELPVSFDAWANLRRLSLYRMIYFSADHLSSASLSALLRLVLRAAPRLESLYLKHGEK